MDQYREQYKKETEEIHAPADLIARTKAAVREEEARLQRESGASAELTKQAAEPVAQKAESPVQEISVTAKKGRWGAAARKWVYPLSAAAAIIMLVSVSLMMGGLRAGKLSSESPAYEMAAADADSGGEETAAAGAGEAAFDKEAFEEVFPEAEAAAEEAPAAEEEPEDMSSEMEAADTTAGMAADSEGGYGDGMAADFAAEAPASIVGDDMDETKRAASSEAEKIENTMSQKEEAKEILREDTSADITVEKVWKKPAFVSRKDVETKTYQNKVFQIVKEENGWAAYVESENGGGYVIRGEAESVETFLEEGYRRLEEMSW